MTAHRLLDLQDLAVYWTPDDVILGDQGLPAAELQAAMNICSASLHPSASVFLSPPSPLPITHPPRPTLHPY